MGGASLYLLACLHLLWQQTTTAAAKQCAHLASFWRASTAACSFSPSLSPGREALSSKGVWACKGVSCALPCDQIHGYSEGSTRPHTARATCFATPVHRSVHNTNYRLTTLQQRMHARTHARTHAHTSRIVHTTLACASSCCAPLGRENASTTCCFTLPSSSATRSVNRRSNRPLLSVEVGPAALALLLLLLIPARCSSATAAAADARVTGLQ